MDLPSPLPGSCEGLGDDPSVRETEYLTQTYYACPPQDAESVQEGIQGVGDEDNNLSYWVANLARSRGSYLYEAQAEMAAMGEAQPSSGIVRWSEGNVELGYHEQNSPPTRIHAMRRHRRHRSRHHGRQSMVPRVEAQAPAQAQTETRHRPEEGPERGSQLEENPDMGLSDEEHRVLAEFDAAVRHLRSSGAAITRQDQAVGLHYGFGIE